MLIITRGHGTLGYSQHVPAKYRQRPKKALPSARGAPGTVTCGKSGPDYCITFIKRLDDGMR